MRKQLAAALITLGALGGLQGCSEGDSATINIDAPTSSNDVVNSNNTTTTNTNTDAGTDTGGATDPVVECPAFTTEAANGQCVLPSTISSDAILVAGVDYLMTGRVTVGNGNGELTGSTTLADGSALQNVTLTIEPGVNVYGETGTFANLVITRGSKIMAMGTKDAPIVFSSDDAGISGAGEWGGLILHGFGPHNECADGGTVCNIDSEGESGFAGGYNANDNSGVLKYVVVAEGGYEFSPGNEINGISLVGVGAGTTMEYIQVEGNSDDGIEFYGGTVNLKYGVFTNNLDDSVDWDEGYQGNLQYIIVKQSPNGSGEAFEMDTQGTNLFLSKPTLSNVTIIADKKAADDEYILNFKAGSGGFFHNTVVTVAADNATPLTRCVNVSGADAQALVGSALVLNNWIQDCAAGVGDRGILANVDGLDNGTINAVFADLDANLASQAPEAVVVATDWNAINAALPESSADADFLDSVPFIGAVSPSGTNVWWAGWTVEGTLGVPEIAEPTCPTGTTEVEAGVCQLPANIGSDLTLNAGVEYLMVGRVTVGNGNEEIQEGGALAGGTPVANVTLTIEAGVEVKGKTGTFANLIITRGSKIEALGTKSAPIIFSSDDAGYDDAGEWGGLILHGYAPHNECAEGGTVCNIDSEGESGFAGGYDPADSSGTLRYVVVAEGGYEFAPGNEINGISLVGVGNGTEIDYIQVQGNSDDGIEFYGGTVNVKHGVFTNNLDDSVDWDEGYQGNLQYIIVKQSPNGSGEAFEMDTQGTNLFLSKPTLANVTIVADKKTPDDNFILNFKAGSGGFFHNTVVTVAGNNTTPLTTCINVSGADAEALVGTALVINNWIQDCAVGEGDQGTLSSANVNFDTTSVSAVPAALGSLYESLAPEAVLAAPLDWTAINGAFSESVADTNYLDATDYIGAVDPDGSDPWWAGWVLPGTL